MDEAEVYGEQALAIGLAEQFHPLLINTYENLYLLSKAKRNFTQALFYHESLLSTKEKLFDKDRNKQMQELSTKYDQNKRSKRTKSYKLKPL